MTLYGATERCKWPSDGSSGAGVQRVDVGALVEFGIVALMPTVLFLFPLAP